MSCSFLDDLFDLSILVKLTYMVELARWSRWHVVTLVGEENKTPFIRVWRLFFFFFSGDRSSGVRSLVEVAIRVWKLRKAQK